MGNHLDLPATTTYGEQHTQITGQKGSQLTYLSTLGGSSFLRTFQYVHSHHGLVVVKVMLSVLCQHPITRLLHAVASVSQPVSASSPLPRYAWSGLSSAARTACRCTPSEK